MEEKFAMRNKIYSESHRKLYTFIKNVINNSFVKKWINKNQAVVDDAITDPLTGLYNQFGINSYLKELHPQIGINYAIVLLNVDNYKDIHAQYGIKAAEAALVSTADIISNNLRETDLVGRYGEHEFIVILSNIKLEYAHSVARRIAKNVQGKSLKVKTQSILLQASCGISVSEQDTYSDAILQQADQALFAAKSNGFNQIRDHRPS